MVAVKIREITVILFCDIHLMNDAASAVRIVPHETGK